MAEFEFFVSLIDPVTDLPLGSGPLESVTSWRYTPRLDEAGEFSFVMSANDRQASLVQNRINVKAHALIGDAWTELGFGKIEKIDAASQVDGHVLLQVSGMEITGELNYRNTRRFQVGSAHDGVPGSFAEAVFLLETLAPAGWDFVSFSGPLVDDLDVYWQFDSQSILGASIWAVKQVGYHLFRPEGKTLHFTSEWDDSGLVAQSAGIDASNFTCDILNLTREVNTYELQTRIYPIGNGTDRFTSTTLAYTDRVAPVGYVLNKTENYIENTAATALYGLVDFPDFQYKEIAPISGTDADLVAASNALYDAAFADLERRSSMAAHVKYTLSVARCNVLLRPMQTIHVIWHDSRQNFTVDEDLYILQAGWEVDATGYRTTDLVVSNLDAWPYNNSDANAVKRVAQGRIFQTNPQQSLNEWWGYATLFVGDSQADHVAEMPFVMGRSVLIVKQVVFRFKVEAVLIPAFTYELADDETEQNEAADTGDTVIQINSTLPDVDNVNSTTLTVGSATPDAETAAATSGIGEMTNTPVDYSPDPTIHRHPISSHTHDFAHGHDITADVTAGGNSHYHTGNSHAHETTIDNSNDDDSHFHSLPQHVHPLPALTLTLALVRFSALSTYALSDLEYAINGGSWVSLDTATDVQDGYFQVDITDDVTHPTLPFRPAQADGNNVIEIRCKSASAGNGKSAMILMMVGVRTTIQSTAAI